MYYEDPTKVHALTSINGNPSMIPDDDQLITYTDFKKVETITEGNKSLTITYGVDQQRRKSVYTDGSTTTTRYYFGDYEEEITGSIVKKYHYISGGNGLAAIYEQVGSTGTLYYAYSDYQGSLISLRTSSLSLQNRFAYDPWGNRRNVLDWTQKTGNTSSITNRGYTLHEHLDEFNLINMNGRVYDPHVASFLSPDPYIQAPGSWLNYNRYSYCYGNPMVYTDPSGEFIGTLLTLINGSSGASAATGFHYLKALFSGGINFGSESVRNDAWDDARNSTKDTWDDFGDRLDNAWKIDVGLFQTNSKHSNFGRGYELTGRFGSQIVQTIFGNAVAHIHNNLGGVREVDYFDGATVIESYGEGWGATTLGNVIIGERGFYGGFQDHTFVHEYGHYIQSKEFGPFYYPVIGLHSLLSANFTKKIHLSRWYEAQASRYSANYFDQYYGSGVEGYQKNSGLYFSRYAFENGYSPSRYSNPKTGDFNDESRGFTTKGQFHWTDIFFYAIYAWIPFTF